MGCLPKSPSVGSIHRMRDAVRRNVRSELCCFSLALLSVFLPLFSMPTPSCALENKIRSVVSFRSHQDNAVPPVQTSTCRSSSSFLSSKYLFRSMVDTKRSTSAERKKGRVQRRKVNLLPKLEPHRTVAGADRSWKEMRGKKIVADKSAARSVTLPVWPSATESNYQFWRVSSWL